MPQQTPSGPRPLQSTESEITQLLADLALLREQALQSATTPTQIPVIDRFGDQAIGADGQPLFEQAIDLNALKANEIAQDLIRQRLDELGVGVPAQQITPNVAAQIAEQEKARESREEIARLDREERARSTNISAALDEIELAIRRGDLDEREGTRRLTAAVEAADVELRTLESVGGRNLPAGEQFFPNLGPDSPAGQAVSALTGQPFSGISTGGTFGVNPGALTGPITAAAGPTGSATGINAAQQQAQAVLGGSAPRLTGPGVQPVVPALTGG